MLRLPPVGVGRLRQPGRSSRMGQARKRTARVADECPYRRPFPIDFGDCEAFTASEFVALDLQHRPLPSVLTCRHLAVGLGEHAGSHYARCRIGDADARAAWVLQVRKVALDSLRSLSAESRVHLRTDVRRLWEAKGATLREPHNLAAQRDLRASADDLLASAAAFYGSHGEELALADLTPEVAIELVRRMIESFTDVRSASPEITVTDEMLAGLPASLKILLRPDDDPTG